MQSKVTCVSGYWKVKNKHGDKYNSWFKNTLQINCPYVFFGDKESIEFIKKFRGNLPTHYIELSMEDFKTYKYKDEMITHSRHCPSVEVNLIWNEKIFMIERAYQINPFCSEFFCWVDAGICTYRNKMPPQTPFPNINKLNSLPKDKIIYSSTNRVFDRKLFVEGKYHLTHHISGTYILHKDILHKIVDLYNKYLNIINKKDIYTDQVLLTHIYKDHPELFHKFCDGYGGIFKWLM
jgi:hypothetical protein